MPFISAMSHVCVSLIFLCALLQLCQFLTIKSSRNSYVFSGSKANLSCSSLFFSISGLSLQVKITVNPTQICRTSTTHLRYAGQDSAVVPAITDTAVMKIFGVLLMMNKMIGMPLFCDR